MNSTLRARALSLLARREHARAELARKLTPHAGSLEELNALLDDLSERRLLSDARYVEMRLHARGSRFGNARLAHELRTQGISDELVDAALAETDDELTRARQVWQRKFGNKADQLDEADKPARAAERARQMRFLMSRGFSAETIRRVLSGNFEDD